MVVVITDGRATSGPDGVDPVDAAINAADAIRRAGIDSVIVDVEGAGGSPSLGLARHLADRMGARHIHAVELSAGTVENAVRDVR
jgi:magnesium chelatase subunit D